MLKGLIISIVWFLILGATGINIPAAPAFTAVKPLPQLNEKQLSPIAGIVEKAMREGKIVGAVVLIGNKGKIVYRRAFGYRTLKPEKLPMTTDTIFDVASLTKVVATTTAVMQLVEAGKLGLDAPVARYWPAFRVNGKENIIIRDLLTHYSGLRPDLNLNPKWCSYRTAMKKIIAEKPLHPPRSIYIYSDINFAVLGEVVRLVSGKAVDEYCSIHIFKPLGMKDTFFKPPQTVCGRIAPTKYHKGKMLCGYVNDPTCRVMGGVSGHAGLFATADDLSIFAQMLLNKGNIKGIRILKPETVEQITIPQSPLNKPKIRGLGWDIEAPFGSNRERLLPVGAYGHMGYTGTSIWIDPVTETYIIILANRFYRHGDGDIKELRASVKSIVADALGPISCEQILVKSPGLMAYYKHKQNAESLSSTKNKFCEE